MHSFPVKLFTMKQFLPFCFISLLFVSCNNSDSISTAGTSLPETSEVPAKSGCASFVWFKKGTVMEYKMSDASGQPLPNSITTIQDIRQEGDALVAEYSTTYSEGKQVSASYRCENGRLYINMKSLFDNMLEPMRQPGMEVEVTDGFLSFPSDMKVGDKLDGSTFQLSTKKDGKVFMTMTSTVKDRVVEATEKIATPAGSWDCLRITEIRTTTTSMMGRAMGGKDTKSTQWFAPGAGMVKFVSYDDEGKIQYQTELVSIK
jgi:hypothetical protein